MLSADAAGNVETGPIDVYLPPYNPQINLGALPVASIVVSPRPNIADPPTTPAINALFAQMLLGVPSHSSRRPAEFGTVFEPFVAAAFAYNVPQSGADIGPLGIALMASRSLSVVASSNELYRFGRAGEWQVLRFCDARYTDL